MCQESAQKRLILTSKHQEAAAYLFIAKQHGWPAAVLLARLLSAARFAMLTPPTPDPTTFLLNSVVGGFTMTDITLPDI